MNYSRFNALDATQNRSDIEYSYLPEDTRISSYFGSLVFDDSKMKKYLDEDSYLAVKAVIQSGKNLNVNQANKVASAMKTWAMEQGATHYAHWFQPLTGKTAEKHDSFFTLDGNMSAVEEFGGKELAQQEPDGSSFPGGGLRSTFEARGYTAWDPSSPAFILEVGEGKTLCIPTIFVTYSGDALDYKLPLLKSKHILEEAALDVLHYFDKDAEKVSITLGWEQEYFVIDKSFYESRPDLMLTGRTLLGTHSVKGQQLEDHYFGTIPERVYSFMRDMEIESHKLGIPLRTRHNEVGPAQYEAAPMFEDLNIAIDHNQLLMDLMERVGKRHKLAVLLHEKPFEGVNGSGKHNNWSMASNTGKNLLSPGEVPGRNLRFLTFFINTIKAVHEYADLLRASVASASNDHRLGGNEAPPAIMSVYIGKALYEILEFMAEGKDLDKQAVNEVLSFMAKVPDLKKDNTDRNRTSPFAFTGNKFEMRMVGSSMNCAAPMTILNAIVGTQLKAFKVEVDKQVAGGALQDEAILGILRRYVNESKAIIFEGDGYSEDWKNEARKRGLGNAPNTPDALKVYKTEKVKSLFAATGIFTERELEAHYEVMQETYSLKIDIESKTMVEICTNMILPAALAYQTKVAQNITALKSAGVPENTYSGQLQFLTSLTNEIESFINTLDALRSATTEAHQSDSESTAHAYCYTVKPLMHNLRIIADQLETIVEDELWPLTKYREMMFIR